MNGTAQPRVMSDRGDRSLQERAGSPLKWQYIFMKEYGMFLIQW